MCVCVAVVTWPVADLQGKGRDQQVGVHGLGAVLSHLLLRGYVGRRGGVWSRHRSGDGGGGR